MSTVKVQGQKKGMVFQANVMVLQETRLHAVQALDTLQSAITSKEFQKLKPEQAAALREVRTLLVDLKPRESAQ